jgi:hypothetical protein
MINPRPSDTALSFSPAVINMLRDVVGLTQVVFGTDNPYLRLDMAVRLAGFQGRAQFESVWETKCVDNKTRIIALLRGEPR